MEGREDRDVAPVSAAEVSVPGETAPEADSSGSAADRVQAAIPALEALLFAAEAPVSLEELRLAFPEEERASVKDALARLQERYRADGGGLQIIPVAGGYRMTTRGDFDAHLRALFRQHNRFRPGRAALETLAIVAYRQPITVPEIAEIRGKDPSAVLRTLLDKRMIRIVGRKRVVGKPFLYGTTRDFLVHFGLNSVEDLPSMEEFSEMVGERFDIADEAEESPEVPESPVPAAGEE